MAAGLNNVVPIGQPGSMLDYALAYAAIGWPVFPVNWVDQETNAATGEIVSRCSCGDAACDRIGKHPRTDHGLKDATTSPESIAAWWGRWPVANIAVATGTPCWVLDIDCKNGKRGDLVLEALERERGMLPATLQARSQSGGRHYFFRGQAGVANSTDRLGPGVDVRGAGGYIIVEPSRISGTYAFEDWEALGGGAPELAPAPGWLLAAVMGSVERVKADPIGRRVASDATLVDLRSAIAWLDCGHYDTWIEMGMALRSLGDPGFWLWDEWSRPFPRYSAQEARKKWHSFNPTQINYESIFKRAAILGWQNPNAKPAAPKIDPALAEVVKPRLAPAAAANTGADLVRLPGKQIQLAADWISGLFDSPTPAISTAGAIALASVVTGRLYRSESANWTSLMMVIVGPSGVGKNYVKVGIERLLSRAGLDRLVAGDFYTHQSALYWALHQAPCHICISDEFGENFLEARKNNNANKMTVFKALKKVYSDADHIYKPESYSLAGLSKKQRDDSDTKPVINPSLSMLGLSTQRQFWTEIKASHIEGGLMNRMVIVNVDGQHRVRTARGPDEPPTELVQWVGRVRRLEEPLRHTAFDLAPSSVFVEFSGQARRRFEEMRALQDARGDKLEQVGLGVMTRRWRENAMRMATGLASFESPASPVVSGDVADWACRYVHANGEATIEQLGANAGETDYAHQLNSVRAFVDATGQRGATDYELKRGISHIRRRDLAELLAHLAEAGVITQIERKSDKGGRPTSAWVMAAGGEA